MTSNGKHRGREGPRKYAYNIDAAREREMHLYLTPSLDVNYTSSWKLTRL